MEKFIPVAAALLLCLMFTSCRSDEKNSPPVVSGYTYYSSVTEEPASVSEETTTVPAETTTSAETSSAVQSEPATTMILVTLTAQQTVSQTVPATEPTSAVTEPSSVDLSIAMPEANATMKVDKSPSNRFVCAVSSSYGIDAARLAAVVSVPDNGQNYVFEFSSPDARGADDIVRVFLLDSACSINSIAAAESSQRKNISQTENWFCMNVLIKGVIYPAIKDKF